MKTFEIKYFASVRETVGVAEQTVSSEAGSVRELLVELTALSKAHAAALAHPRLCVAVNQTIVKFDAALQSGDEVAFFPPVTGG